MHKEQDGKKKSFLQEISLGWQILVAPAGVYGLEWKFIQVKHAFKLSITVIYPSSERNIYILCYKDGKERLLLPQK